MRKSPAPAATAAAPAPAAPAPVVNHGADTHFSAYLTALEGREKALHGFLALVGDAPTYETWESFRLGFCAVYRAKRPRAGDDAVNTAWCRFVRDVKCYVEENNLLQTFPEKPKSASPEAARKQAARALPEAVAEAKTLEEIDAIAIPPGADGAKIQAAALRKRGDLILKAAKESEKVAGAALKGLKIQIIAAVRVCNDRAVLEAALVALQAKPVAA